MLNEKVCAITYFPGFVGKPHWRAHVKTDWCLRLLCLTLSIKSYLCLCFHGAARKANEQNPSEKQSCLSARVLDVFLLCSVSVKAGQWSSLEKNRSKALFLREPFKLKADFFFSQVRTEELIKSTSDKLCAVPWFLCLMHRREKAFSWKFCFSLKLLPGNFE